MPLIAPYVCKNCKKGYERYSYYKKHIINCESVNTNFMTGSINDLSIRETLQYLIDEKNMLKEQLVNMQREKNVERKKIDLLTWLNKNFDTDTLFNLYIDNIEVTEKDLLALEDNTIQDCIKVILERYFTKESNFIKAFNLKNKIYVFKEKNKWQELCIEDFKPLVFKIHKEFLITLNKWHDNHEKELSKDSMANLYLTLVKKVNKINLSNGFITNTYKILYQHLKCELKIIEYIIE